MSPFIVTTTRLLPSAEDHSTEEYVERLAVATLEEAQNAVSEACEGRVTMLEQTHFALSVSKLGRMIVLPDGTVVEVEAVSWHDLWHRTPLGHRGGAFFDLDGDEILVAFNAFNAQEAKR